MFKYVCKYFVINYNYYFLSIYVNLVYNYFEVFSIYINRIFIFSFF